jgi:heme-degrading monooxygenase HmoA
MIARITTFQLKPGAIDDLIRRFQDSIAHSAAQQPGFGGLTVLTDPRTSRVVSIGLWATETELLAGERKDDYQEQFAKIGELLSRPPDQEIYEISVQVELTEQGLAHIRGI